MKPRLLEEPCVAMEGHQKLSEAGRAAGSAGDPCPGPSAAHQNTVEEGVGTQVLS